MKVCKGCGVEKELDDFHKSKKGSLGRVNKCKLCISVEHKQRYTPEVAAKKNADGRKRYAENRDKIREKNNLYHKKNTELVRQYKISCGCVNCGYNKCAEALEFHHLDPDKKSFSVSKMVDRPRKLKEEINKCVVICSNCYREHHAGVTEIAEPNEIRKFDLNINTNKEI